ncbi:MAG: hypothetical protein ACQEW0_02200 [Pseudomonadota bacterium]
MPASIPQWQDIESAETLQDLDDVLTAALAKRQLQTLIQGDNLNRLIQRAHLLCNTQDSEARIRLAALLGRLSAVARSRTEHVFAGFEELMQAPPASLETLKDGDEKAYAATALWYLHPAPDWLVRFAIAEAFALDSAENARKVLLEIIRDQTSDYTAVLNLLTVGFDNLAIESSDARLRRLKRILDAWKDASQDHFWPLDSNPGEALSAVVRAALRYVKNAKEESLATEVGDRLLELLLRVVQLRFSYALEADTYAALKMMKAQFGTRLWTYLRTHSQVRPRLLSCMREACLVLARQEQTDMALLEAMKVMYATRTSMTSDIKRHFAGHHGLDSDISGWWISGGTQKASRSGNHKELPADADMIIGQLLLESENARLPLENVRINLLPLIEEFVQDPVVSASLRKGTNGFIEMTTLLRQLCRLRRIELSGLQGDVINYSRTRHEMEDGHHAGVTEVRVVRDQVIQTLGSRERVIVKALVTPA